MVLRMSKSTRTAAKTEMLALSKHGPTSLTLALTPSGRLKLQPADGATELPAAQAERLTCEFARGSGHGLLSLAFDDIGSALPPVLAYWRQLAYLYITALCAVPNIAESTTKPAISPPSDAEFETIAAAVPPTLGSEYVSSTLLGDLWRDIDVALDQHFSQSGLPFGAFLKRRSPAWNLVGRVHFNLAENRKDADAPFAFLATYTTTLSASAKPQHLSLGKALQEYAGANDRDRLLSLLAPVQRAAETCDWLQEMVKGGEIYQPLRWTPSEAMRLLGDVPALEAAGVVVRMPASWRMGRPSRPQVKTTVGATAPSLLGLDAMLDFDLAVTLDGDALSAAEIKGLLAQSDGLAFIRGQWVEVDRERLMRTLEQFQAVERRAAEDGLSFAEAMRMLAGAGIGENAAGDDAAVVDWSSTVAGPWLSDALAAMRHPDRAARVEPGSALNAKLRPYQQAGLQWLHLLANLRLGACLADDMGLGKTIQVISLLLVLKRDASKAAPHVRRASLLVAPASLLSNWDAEIARFAPGLKAVIAHPSAMASDKLKALDATCLGNVDLVITSYGTLVRAPNLAKTAWRLAILDEAQTIKNPGAKQTKAVKQLDALSRIALTGTPIENRLGDLWSIFDFLNPGLLGTAKQFGTFAKQLGEASNTKANAYAPLRELVRPYILRRLKTDKRIIDDLPDKTEMKTFCQLSRVQAALYQQSVEALTSQLRAADGMQRRGLVLAFLMRFKQICNHPSQWLGDGAWAPDDSGKLTRLREIAEEIAARQEKMLVFTQFKETTAPLAAFLGGIFGKAGVVLTGETAVAKRKDLVRRFQEDDDVPFFVLSVKAGGSGLNLTAASHVVHFDRWWNPAVEAQATDRAFRIGQKRNVLVHKFVCRGTVEDRIDQMIEQKKQLAGDFLEGGGGEMVLTEMKDAELLALVALDLNAALKE